MLLERLKETHIPSAGKVLQQCDSIMLHDLQAQSKHISPQ